MNKNTVKPFLKWAGGKRWLIPKIKHLLPASFQKYYEPFVGAGALFFYLEPDDAVLSDINKELINAYIQIRDSLPNIITRLKKLKYSKTIYMKMRTLIPKNHVERAVRFIYLNRTCWNGLYRENRNGEFNVPFGRYSNPTICDEQNLVAASRLLQKKKIICSDFQNVIKKANRGDFVYLDPPYTTKGDSNFLEYNAKLFSWEDQKRLARGAHILNKRKCLVMVTNVNKPVIRKLYKGFSIMTVCRTSLIAGQNENRGKVRELLITNFSTRTQQ